MIGDGALPAALSNPFLLKTTFMIGLRKSIIASTRRRGVAHRAAGRHHPLHHLPLVC